ncbi:MAG: hypothetical protein IKM74_01840 [Bacteroidales bacterium]|nr:hypothetical protein [Bacteroidales bacterium]
MIIPIGTEKEDLKARKNIITAFYAEWNRNNPERRVFNDDLNDYIYVVYLSMDETRRHAAKRYNSTLAVLQLDTILKKAKRIGNPLPVKQGSKNQKVFSKILKMECELEEIGTVKLLVGIKKTTGEKIQYCITTLEQ